MYIYKNTTLVQSSQHSSPAFPAGHHPSRGHRLPQHLPIETGLSETYWQELVQSQKSLTIRCKTSMKYAKFYFRAPGVSNRSERTETVMVPLQELPSVVRASRDNLLSCTTSRGRPGLRKCAHQNPERVGLSVRNSKGSDKYNEKYRCISGDPYS